MKRSLLAAVLTTLFVIGPAAAATTTQALPLPQAATCSGVWVVVDYGSLGGVSTRCAGSYGTGTAALRSAGFSPTLDGGMLTRISGKPSSVDVNKNYWSYWHATRKSDGTYSGWSYSSQGSNSYHPSAGTADGWRYQPLADGKVAPGAAPPRMQAAAPKPTAKPTPKPTKPTAKPTVTAKATATASPTRTTAAATTSATPPAVSPEPVETALVATDEPVESATVEPVGDSSPTDNGSPVGAIAAGAFVVVGGAGVGGWWLLKGRRR